MALTLGDNFSYQGAKPLDARLIYSTVASMKAVADSTMYDGCMAYCTATSKTYQWKSTNAVDETTGKWREFTSGSGDTIQVDTLPTAGADELGNVYQYIGSTTLTLTHGYFYECVSDGAGTPTYSWANVPTSKGGHDIKNDGVAVTARDTMNFTDFDIADDSTNLETDIKAHRLTQAEIIDIVSPLPSTPIDMPILFDETGTEYVVGYYKTSQGKKPIYQKSYTGTCNANSVVVDANFNDTYIDNVVEMVAYTKQYNTSYHKYFWTNTYYQDTNDNFRISVHPDNGLMIIGGSNYPLKPYTYIITVRYTKTTDVAS